MRVELEYHDFGTDADIPIFIAMFAEIKRQYTPIMGIYPRVIFEVDNYEHLQKILEDIYPRTRHSIKIIRVGTWKDKIKRWLRKRT